LLVNQAGRRNLTEEQLKITIGRIYNNSKQVGFKIKLDDSVNLSETSSTAEEIGNKYNDRTN